ncbi:MAG: FMN-binding protein [Spirochaetaceae bacterium]|jgi:electron transport complex protein RnfG|nr:FMN-binding protein [Spirochaetaceae bacterium]
MNVKGMLRLGLTLALFATAACVGLAFVYTGTAQVIAERQRTDLDAALRDLFPDADSFTDITGTIQSPDPLVIFESQYAALRGQDLIGVAIRSSRGSYGGPIKVLTGIETGGRISRVRILEHSDTPGLGANAASPAYFVDKAAKLTFYGQFSGKTVSDPFEVKNDVAAVTASTITSEAVTDSVRAAGSAASAWFSAEEVAKNPGGSR